MKKLIMATAAIFGLGIAAPAHAAKEIDCMVMWEKADLNKNGILKGDDATAYLDAIKKSGKTYELKTVGQLSSTEFMAACKDDAFKISFYRAQLWGDVPLSCPHTPCLPPPRSVMPAMLASPTHARASLASRLDRSHESTYLFHGGIDPLPP
jgi:hypothetical protein